MSTVPVTPAVAAGPGGRPHLAHLDGLRGLAALVVVASHCWAECYPNAMARRPVGLTARLAVGLGFGHWAVVVFLVLSGYCLALPLVGGDGRLRGGVADFYRRRARRILPPYFAALALSLGLIYTLIGTRNGTHWDYALSPRHFGVDRRGLLWAVLLVGDWAGSYQVNHAFWSVQVEAKIYLLFPLLAWAGRRWSLLQSAIATAVLSVAASAVAHRYAPGLDGVRLHFPALFALGVAAAAVAPRANPRVAAAVAAAALLAVLAWAYHLGLPRALYADRPLDPGVGLAAAAALVACAAGPPAWTAPLRWPPLLWIGGLSYSLYLIHAPLVQVAYRFAVHPLRLPPAAELATLIAVATAGSLAAAVPFFRLCERPFMSARLRRSHPPAGDPLPRPEPG